MYPIGVNNIMNFNDQKFVVGLLKQGQDSGTKEERASARQRKKDREAYRKKTEPVLGSAYPLYGKSIIRGRRNPGKAGRTRALEFGSVGALLGALAGLIATGKPKHVGLGAALGAVTGGVPGYISGSDEAKSDYSRLLFLRRLGIRSKGEEEAADDIPAAAPAILGGEGYI